MIQRIASLFRRLQLSLPYTTDIILDEKAEVVTENLRIFRNYSVVTLIQHSI